MTNNTHALPPLFKGLALFTPGGDLAYCIDVHKQSRWHLQLCTALQDRLQLSEPPYFLVPCYTATVDRWRGPRSSETLTVAEARPLVMHHRALLSAVFNIDSATWRCVAAVRDLCDPQLLVNYRRRFPQLWQYHNLVIQTSATPLKATSGAPSTLPVDSDPPRQVLTLFVAGQSSQTGTTLIYLHQALQQSSQPYTLKVIDIDKHPDQVPTHRITTTPTLIKLWPPPIKRLTGQLTDVAAIVNWLELDA